METPKHSKAAILLDQNLPQPSSEKLLAIDES